LIRSTFLKNIYSKKNLFKDKPNRDIYFIIQVGTCR